MTDYTKDAHALPYPQGVDRVAVAADIQALATKAGIAISQESARVEESAMEYADAAAAQAEKAARVSSFRATTLQNVELNKFNTPGVYGISNATASGISNAPSGFVGGLLEVRVNSAQIFQTLRSYANGNVVWERQGTLSGWFGWQVVNADTNKWVPTQLKDVDLNAVNVPGTYNLLPADTETVQNRPQGWNSGVLVVYVNSQQIFQTAYEYVGGRRVWDRLGTTAAFLGWRRTDPGVSSTAPDASVAGTSPARSGFKNAYLALNVSDTSGTESNVSASIRWPLQFGIGFKRARLHVRNWAWASSDTGTTYSGPVAFSGAWMAKATAGNQFSGTATQVLPAFNTPADGSEYVSPWFNYELTAGASHLLSVGFTAAQGSLQVRNRGGCWRTTSADDAPAASGYSGGYSIFSPFDVWLEVEVPASTPILAGLGDSNTAATGTFFPVHDSWLSQYCRNAGALPYFMAQHGATADSWDTESAVRWNRFREDVARPDAVVHFLGRNDIQAGVTLSQMQERFTAVVEVARKQLTPHVYAATITPGNTESIEQRTLRQSYNSWLMTKPLGIHDVYDFSAAVSDDDVTIREGDNADGLHFRATGHAAIAGKLSERPVTPLVLSQEEVMKLKVLAL